MAFGAVDSPVFSSESGSLEHPSMLQASESDREKAKMVWSMYQKAKKWKMSMGFGEAEENWDFWKGKHWKKQRPSSYSMAVVNEMYSNTETFLGHIGDSIPESVARGRKAEHREIAETVTKLLNWSDDLNEIRSSLELPVRSACVASFGVYRIDWDIEKDGWRGAPHYGMVDENYFFVSPWAKRVDLADALYVIEARNVPIDYVRKVWERGSDVAPGVWDGTLTASGTSLGTGTGMEYQAFTSTDGLATQLSKEIRGGEKGKDLVTLLEAWIRQDDGSLRYLVVANGIVLEDGPSPYDDEKYPYVVFNVIVSKDHPYGYSMIGFVKSLQKELNEIHSYALDQQRYESDSPLVVSAANVEEGSTPTNSPGSVYIDASPGGNGYYLLSKPGANPKWFTMQEVVLDRIRSIAGNVDILRGERPAGVSTLGGMEIVRDAANVLVHKMTMHIHAVLRRKDLLVISRLRQFMTDRRTVRISKGGGQEEFVSMNASGNLGLNGEFAVNRTIPEDFEADVDFSVSPPGGEQAKFERALSLYQSKAVDTQYLLEEIGEDQTKIEEVLGRLAEQDKAAAEAMAAKSGGGAGSAPPEEGNVMADAISVLSGMAA